MFCKLLQDGIIFSIENFLVMMDLEEKGSKKEKIKSVSKIVAVSLIGVSAILGIIAYSLMFYLSGIVLNVMHLNIYVLFFSVPYAPFMIIFMLIIANLISIPGFIALGVYAYFQYLRLENYIYLRSEKSYQPKLKYRLYYIALVELGVYTAWCFFGIFLYNVLLSGLFFVDLFLIMVMIIVPGIYYALEHLK